MYIEVPVEEWGTLLDETDFPDLRLIMCGYFSTVLTLLYPEDTVDGLVDYLLEAFNQDGRSFLNKSFLNIFFMNCQFLVLPRISRNFV